MSEPAEAAAVARKLPEVISHPLHEFSTSSRGAVVSSLCFSWVTLFTPAFSDLGLLSRTVCSPRIQNKGFRIPGWRRKQRKPSSPQKPVSGKELPLTFQQLCRLSSIQERHGDNTGSVHAVCRFYLRTRYSKGCADQAAITESSK